MKVLIIEKSTHLFIILHIFLLFMLINNIDFGRRGHTFNSNRLANLDGIFMHYLPIKYFTMKQFLHI